MSTIRLMKHIVDVDNSEILYNRPFSKKSIEEDFEVKRGKWRVEKGWLIGENRNNSADLIISKNKYLGNVIIEFDAKTVFPATRDINVSFHMTWDEEQNERGLAYVFGLEGWFHGCAGFERSPEYTFVVNTKLFNFNPRKTYHIIVGNIDNILYMVVDGVLVYEISDPNPIDMDKSGLMGFEAFCTKVKYKNLVIRRAKYVKDFKLYNSEF